MWGEYLVPFGIPIYSIFNPSNISKSGNCTGSNGRTPASVLRPVKLGNVLLVVATVH
jgi:hypothetical protein